jgi:hypothetical protein
MAIGGKPAARALKSKGVKPGKDSAASAKTKAAYTKMAKAGRNGFKA